MAGLSNDILLTTHKHAGWLWPDRPNAIPKRSSGMVDNNKLDIHVHAYYIVTISGGSHYLEKYMHIVRGD